MIWQIVKKQGLTLLRNPLQLLLLIGLPIILIAILGTSLGSIMNGEAVKIDAKIAFIEHSDEQEQVARFIRDIEERQFPAEVKEIAEHFTPIESLKKDVFGELENVIQLEILKPSEKDNVIDNDAYAAVIEIPENFTYDTLQSIFLEKGAAGTLHLYQNEGKELAATIVEDVLKEFQEQTSLLTFAGKHGMTTDDLQLGLTNMGEVIAIDHHKSISAKNYYAIGMAVMNVLFIASTIGSYAFQEKKSHVFNRVIIADVSRWVYFIGIFIAGATFGFVHLLIVFGVSWLAFGVVWPDLLAFFIVTLGLGIAVGGLSVLLTAISYRIDSELITNFFQSIVITIIAFVGGSFFPIGDLSEGIQIIGNFTPNGASMTAYLSILRGSDVSAILHHVIFLTIFAAILIVIAALSFPKRGQMT